MRLIHIIYRTRYHHNRAINSTKGKDELTSDLTSEPFFSESARSKTRMSCAMKENQNAIAAVLRRDRALSSHRSDQERLVARPDWVDLRKLN